MEFTLNGQADNTATPTCPAQLPAGRGRAGEPQGRLLRRRRLRLLHGAGGRQAPAQLPHGPEGRGRQGRHHPGGSVRPAERDAFADGFVLKGGVQCGFCTPGHRHAAPPPCCAATRTPRARRSPTGCTGNLCRCTGYKKIVDSVECAAESPAHRPAGGRSPKAPAPWAPGTPSIPPGKRCWASGCSWATWWSRAWSSAPCAAPTTPGPRCSGWTSTAALQVPGVLAVLTARDIKGKRINGMIYRDWPVMVLEGEETRCIGDVLASVAAETEAAALQAAGLVRVEYEVLPPVTDIFEALEPGAPQLTDHGNVLSVTEVKRGRRRGGA